MFLELYFMNSTSNIYKCQANYNNQSKLHILAFDLYDLSNFVYFKKR